MTPMRVDELLLLCAAVLVAAGALIVAFTGRTAKVQARRYAAAIARHRQESRTRSRVDVDYALWLLVEPELARHTSDHYARAGSPCSSPDTGFCAAMALREAVAAGGAPPSLHYGCGPGYPACRGLALAGLAPAAPQKQDTPNEPAPPA
jgi:hypothetical protein